MTRMKLPGVTVFILECMAPVTITGVAEQLTRPSAPPSFVYGTWIWDPTRSRSDVKLPSYRCYIEHLEDLGNGKTRIRDHRIRVNDIVVRNDAQFQFDGTPRQTQADTTVSYAMTGLRSYVIAISTRGVTTFVVTREVSVDGLRMTHLGQGTINGQLVRNEFVFKRSDGSLRSGECGLD